MNNEQVVLVKEKKVEKQGRPWITEGWFDLYADAKGFEASLKHEKGTNDYQYKIKKNSKQKFSVRTREIEKVKPNKESK